MNKTQAQEKARKLLNDPWGAPVADDVIELVAQALIDAYNAGIEEAAGRCVRESEALEISGWPRGALYSKSLAVHIRALKIGDDHG